MWITPFGDTLRLVQHVSSHVSEDTGFVSVTGNWSGTSDDAPTGATVLIDDVHELWHQVGPNHVQMTYVQNWTVNGEPRTYEVIKDLTYEGSEVLPYDMVLTISNIEVQCDEVEHVLYSEWEEHLAPASSIPSLTEWGLIIFSVMLLGFITWVFIKRRKVVGVGG